MGQLKAALPSMMDSTGIPAISIALIENGKVTWTDGIGVKNKEKKQPISRTTIFRGASLGKPIFAYAVLQLCQSGKLALDTPLLTYVPQSHLEKVFFKGHMSDEQIKLITARMVLSHTSGLPNWRSEGKPITTMFPPGSRYSYSGEGYYLLQHVVEYVTQEAIETFMQKIVFKPLGMNSSSYVYHPADSLSYASSYDQAGKRVPDEVEAANVAHTLRTTAEDYARFVVALMDMNGIPDTATRAIVKPQIPTDICQPGAVSWGAGLAIQHTATGNFFCQWAKSPSASGYVIGSLTQKKALIYFVNIANQGLRIAERLVKIGLDYQDPLFACFGVKPYNYKQ
ncbi:hypothetical protein GCM10028804_16430 [Larkinella terrae]